MEDLQRVDIKLSKSTLKWAAIEAAKLDISRRQYLSDCVLSWKGRVEAMDRAVEVVQLFKGGR